MGRAYVYRVFVNSLEIPWTVYDYNQDPHTLEPGETKRLAVNFTDDAVSGIVSNPPIGMQKIINCYRNPSTGRMEIEFLDAIEK